MTAPEPKVTRRSLTFVTLLRNDEDSPEILSSASSQLATCWYVAAEPLTASVPTPCELSGSDGGLATASVLTSVNVNALRTTPVGRAPSRSFRYRYQSTSEPIARVRAVRAASSSAKT